MMVSQIRILQKLHLDFCFVSIENRGAATHFCMRVRSFPKSDFKFAISVLGRGFQIHDEIYNAMRWCTEFKYLAGMFFPRELFEAKWRIFTPLTFSHELYLLAQEPLRLEESL